MSGADDTLEALYRRSRGIALTLKGLPKGSPRRTALARELLRVDVRIGKMMKATESGARRRLMAEPGRTRSLEERVASAKRAIGEGSR